MSAEFIEASIGLWSLVKWLIASICSLFIALLGWNMKRAQNDIDDMRERQHKHEMDSAERFGTMQATIKMLSDTVPRIHERIDDLHKHLIGGK